MLVMVTLDRVNPVLVYITTGAEDQHIIAVHTGHSSTHDRDCPITILVFHNVDWESTYGTLILKFLHAHINYQIPLSHTVINQDLADNAPWHVGTYLICRQCTTVRRGMDTFLR